MGETVLLVDDGRTLGLDADAGARPGHARGRQAEAGRAGRMAPAHHPVAAAFAVDALDQCLQDVREDMFEYTHNGQTFTLPPYKSIKSGTIRRLRKLPATDFAFTLLEELADADALAVIDDMDTEEFEAMNRAWMEHSGVELGESSGSST